MKVVLYEVWVVGWLEVGNRMLLGMGGSDRGGFSHLMLDTCVRFGGMSGYVHRIEEFNWMGVAD